MYLIGYVSNRQDRHDNSSSAFNDFNYTSNESILICGVTADRAGLRESPQYARSGDTLTVWRLEDRLSQSLKNPVREIGVSYFWSPRRI
jgi:hypothetical protein